MMTLKKLVKVALIFAALAVPGITGPISADASTGFGMDYGMCDMNCMMMMGSSMNSFSPGVTGEMAYYDPQAIYQQMLMMQMTQYGIGLNWNGAQPMGASYMPPIGASALSNTLNWRAMNTAISGN